MDSSNHSRVLKLIQELSKSNEITSEEKDSLKEKLMNDDPTMSQILEICHKFTDKDIKIELKNLVRTDGLNLNLDLTTETNNTEDSSPLGAMLMKRKRKGKKPEEEGEGKKQFSLV